MLSSLPQGNPPPNFLLLFREIPEEGNIGSEPYLLVTFIGFMLLIIVGFRISSWGHKLGESHVDGKLLQVLQLLVDQDGDQEPLGHLQLVLCNGNRE